MTRESDIADAFWDEIRNPQIAELATKIEELCRDYGIRDMEFSALIDIVKDSLFTMRDLLDEDDSDDDDLLS